MVANVSRSAWSKTVEGEEDDRGALAGEAAVGQLLKVVRVAQRGR